MGYTVARNDDGGSNRGIRVRARRNRSANYKVR